MKNRKQLLQEKYKNSSFVNYSIKYFGLIPVEGGMSSVGNFIKEVDKEGNELRLRYYRAVSKRVYELSGYYLKPLPYDDNGNSILYAALSLFTSKEIVDIKLEYLREKKSKFKIKKYFFTKKLSQLDVTNYILQSIDPAKNKIEILSEKDVRSRIGFELFQSDMLGKFKEPEIEEILEQYFLYFPNSSVNLYYPCNKDRVQDCIYNTVIKWGRGLISCSNPNHTIIFSNPKVISDKEFVKILFSQTRYISKKQARTFLYNLNSIIHGDAEYQKILENPTYKRRLLWFDKACKITKHYGKDSGIIPVIIRALKKGKTFRDSRVSTSETLIHKGENIEKILKKTTEIGHEYFLSRINSLLRYSSSNPECLGDIKILETLNKVALRERNNYYSILSDIHQLYKFLFLYPTTEFDYKFYDIFKQIPSHGKYVKYLPQSEESKDIIEQMKIELEFITKELIKRNHEEEEVGETLVIPSEEIPKLERIPFVSEDDLFPWIEDFKPEFSSGIISQTIYKNKGFEVGGDLLNWYQVTPNFEVSKIEGDWSAVKDVKWIVGIRNNKSKLENIIRLPITVFGERGNNIMIGKYAIIYDLSSNTFHFMKIRKNFRDFLIFRQRTHIVASLIYLVEKLKNIRFSVLDYLKLLYVVKEIPEVKDHKGHRIITHANYPKYLKN